MWELKWGHFKCKLIMFGCRRRTLLCHKWLLNIVFSSTHGGRKQANNTHPSPTCTCCFRIVEMRMCPSALSRTRVGVTERFNGRTKSNNNNKTSHSREMKYDKTFVRVMFATSATSSSVNNLLSNSLKSVENVWPQMNISMDGCLEGVKSKQGLILNKQKCLEKPITPQCERKWIRPWRVRRPSLEWIGSNVTHIDLFVGYRGGEGERVWG